MSDSAELRVDQFSAEIARECNSGRMVSQALTHGNQESKHASSSPPYSKSARVLDRIFLFL